MTKVLIVDDAVFMRAILKDILQKNNMEVTGEAESVMKALELYQKIKPDVVIMDITMPEVDGIEGVKRIKAIDPNAKIIMCSSMGQQNFIVKSIQAGAKDFIVKPFQEETVIKSIKRVSAF